MTKPRDRVRVVLEGEYGQDRTSGEPTITIMVEATGEIFEVPIHPAATIEPTAPAEDAAAGRGAAPGDAYELAELIIDAWAGKGLVQLADCEEACDEFEDDTEVVFNAALAAAGFIAAPPAASTPDGHERELLEEIDNRDRAEDIADQLASAIAKLTGATIGEHSNTNDPWANALEASEAAASTPDTELRERYARAIARVMWGAAVNRDSPMPIDWAAADAVMAERDAEIERLTTDQLVLREQVRKQGEKIAVMSTLLRGMARRVDYWREKAKTNERLADSALCRKPAMRAQQQDMVRLPADARGEIERLLAANAGKPAGGVAHKVMLLLTDDWRASPASTEDLAAERCVCDHVDIGIGLQKVNDDPSCRFTRHGTCPTPRPRTKEANTDASEAVLQPVRGCCRGCVHVGLRRHLPVPELRDGRLRKPRERHQHHRRAHHPVRSVRVPQRAQGGSATTVRSRLASTSGTGGKSSIQRGGFGISGRGASSDSAVSRSAGS